MVLGFVVVGIDVDGFITGRAELVGAKELPVDAGEVVLGFVTGRAVLGAKELTDDDGAATMGATEAVGEPVTG